MVRALSDQKFTEEQLQLTWCRLKPGHIMTAVDTSEIVVLSPGIWNLEAGPDFLNAKLKIDGKEVQGSIEIHKKSSDWIAHGHPSNPLYENIILHVVAVDDSASLHDDMVLLLPPVPVVPLKPRFMSVRIAASDKFPQGKCLSFFSSVDDDALNLFFCKAGMKRFYGKVDFILGKMSEKGINMAFMEMIFDACGYKQNRAAFIELFKRLCRYDSLTPEETEAVIWGESGLLPDPASVKLDPVMEEFVKCRWAIWWKIRKEPLSGIEWRRSGLRPMNSPERRIAAVTELVRRIGRYPLMFFANMEKEGASPRVFTKEIVKRLKCNHAIWDKYITFTKVSSAAAAVLGQSRAEDICMNVVLPALQAHIILSKYNTDSRIGDRGPTGYGEAVQLSGKHILHDAGPALEVWLETSVRSLPEQALASMPSLQSNRILETASMKWFAPPGRKRNIIKGAVSQQGILHIYRNFCEAVCSSCAECPLIDLLY